MSKSLRQNNMRDTEEPIDLSVQDGPITVHLYRGVVFTIEDRYWVNRTRGCFIARLGANRFHGPLYFTHYLRTEAIRFMQQCIDPLIDAELI